MLANEQVVETHFSFSPHVPAPPERRQGERHVKILRVAALDIEGRRELCLIRNISAGGLMAHVYSHVKVGERVVAELKASQPLPGRIVWVKDSNAGIAFDSPVDIEGLLAAPGQLDNGWRARSPRIEVDRAAILRIEGRASPARICDVSQSGIKIETDEALKIDGDVVLSPEGFRPIAGVARWQNGRAAGISFNQMIPLTELIAWIKGAG